MNSENKHLIIRAAIFVTGICMLFLDETSRMAPIVIGFGIGSLFALKRD